jgi:uncharacterized protein YgbK (DUF1537 family)
VVIAGSMSEATRAQNAYACEHDFREIAVPAEQILLGKVTPGTIAQTAGESIGHGEPVLISSKAESAADVEATQKIGAQRGMTAVETGVAIAQFLAAVAREIIKHPGLGRLVVAGGETSCFVCERAGICSMEVGLPLDPGVPFCFPMDLGRDLLVVLKSGNFGSKDLYCRVTQL